LLHSFKVCDRVKRIFNMIGFAQKAGKASSGSLAAKTSLLRKKAYLLIMSNDISEKTKEALTSSCTKQKIPWIMLGNKYELGTSVGKAYRVAVAVNDRNLAKAIMNLVKTMGAEVKSTGVVEWPK